MKLFTSVVPQIRHVLTHGRFFTPSVVVLFAGLEMFGRRCVTDVQDTVGTMVLLLIVGCIAFRHRVNPISWIKLMGKAVWWVARFGDRFKVDVGPDLRGTPHIPRGLPFAYYGAVFLLTLWAVGAGAAWYYAPGGWRPYMVMVTYTGYLVLLSLLWGLLFIASLGGVYFPIMLLSRLAKNTRASDARLSRGQLLFLGVYLAATITGVWLLPLWPMLAFAGICWLAVGVLNFLPTKPDSPQLLWRSRTTRVVRAIPLPRLMLAVTTLAVLLLTALILTAAGGNAFGSSDASNTMQLTTIIGTWLGWLTPGLLASAGGAVYLAWRNNPARSALPTAYLGGVPREEQTLLAKQFRQRGWRVNFRTQTSDDVGLVLVPDRQSQLREFDPTWPLPVAVADLQESLLYERMMRRDAIQRRRHFLKKLEVLFREAKSRTYEGGCGFWLAPHLWFVTGLTRDEVVGTGDDEPSFLTEMIGPPYAEVFSFAVRNYIHTLFKGLQIDLIFLEDGVGYKQVTKIFRTLFEVHDKSGGQRRAEDTHFRGLTKIRVLFHEFDVDEPFRPSSIYPEPKFAPLGRLRVMHIFRDRGEDDQRVEPPFNFDASPAPFLVG